MFRQALGWLAKTIELFVETYVKTWAGLETSHGSIVTIVPSGTGSEDEGVAQSDPPFDDEESLPSDRKVHVCSGEIGEEQGNV